MRKVGLVAALTAGLLSAASAQALDAFPGAVGYGAMTQGGRGGEVFVVDSLADAGPGTLRACLEASGPRTCVVSASGTIETMRPIFVRNGNVSIRGEASPGGIQIKIADQPIDGRTSLIFQDVEHVVIRNIRIRPQWNRDNPAFKRQSLDCLTFERSDWHIVDHVSCEWAADEGFNDFQGGRNITYSWNIIGEGLAGHPYGAVSCSDAHRDQCGSITWFANAFHKNGRRSPNMKTAGGEFGPHDLINNLVSAPGEVGAEIWDDHPVAGTGTWANVVGNVGQKGPKTTTRTALVNEGNYNPEPNIWYAHDNIVLGGLNLYGANNPWTSPPGGPTRNAPVAPLSVTPWPASETKAKVLANAGAWPRDAVDRRMVQEMTPVPATGSTPAVAGPWPTLSGATPADSDRDGMPDAWEQAHGYDPAVRDHNADPDGNGYTAVEDYLADRAEQLGLEGGTPGSGGGNPGDTEPPSVPANLACNAASDAAIELTWDASTDNEAVTGYVVLVDGQEAGETAGTSYTVDGLSPATAYELAVTAFDAAGNRSQASAPVSCTTQAGGGTTPGDTGWVAVSAVVEDAGNGGTIAWSNPGNAAADDDAYATALHGNINRTTKLLKATGAVLNVPDTATITGIEVRFAARTNGLAWNIADVMLIKGGAVEPGSDKGTGQLSGTSETWIQFGGAGDTWGLTLTPADVNAPGFGAALALRTASGQTGRAEVDAIEMRVHYQ